MRWVSFIYRSFQCFQQDLLPCKDKCIVGVVLSNINQLCMKFHSTIFTKKFLYGLSPNTSYLVSTNENRTHHLNLKNCQIKKLNFFCCLSRSCSTIFSSGSITKICNWKCTSIKFKWCVLFSLAETKYEVLGERPCKNFS